MDLQSPRPGMEDTQAIFTWEALHELNPDIEIRMELLNQDSVQFAIPRSLPTLGHTRWGKLNKAEQEAATRCNDRFLVGDQLQPLLAQTVFEPSLYQVFNSLIGGPASNGDSAMLHVSPVPESNWGGTYQDLVDVLMLQWAQIPIGLHREVIGKSPFQMNPADKEPFKYVHINPDGTELLRPGDKVFVIINVDASRDQEKHLMSHSPFIENQEPGPAHHTEQQGMALDYDLDEDDMKNDKKDEEKEDSHEELNATSNGSSPPGGPKRRSALSVTHSAPGALQLTEPVRCGHPPFLDRELLEEWQ